MMNMDGLSRDVYSHVYHRFIHTDLVIVFFFFFQAEDGIRDLTVTGVQTCALPISGITRKMPCTTRYKRGDIVLAPRAEPGFQAVIKEMISVRIGGLSGAYLNFSEIGRASCRERV